MDPFDEFEFKPLTEGLGFHKKTSSLKESTQKTSLVEDELNRAIPNAPPGSMDGNSKKTLNIYDDLLKSADRPTIKDMAAQARAAFPLEITEPLPRASNQKIPPQFAGASAKSTNQMNASANAPLGASIGSVNNSMNASIQDPSPARAPKNPYIPPAPGPSIQDRQPLKGSLDDKAFIDETSDIGTRRGAADSPMGGLEKAPVCVRSAVLDFLFVLALSLVFMVSLLVITKSSLTGVMSSVKVDATTQLSMLLLFVAVMQMYVIVARSFFGRTLGEWTFEHQMGSVEQQANAFYPLQVAWRSLVITLTGIVLLPLISLIVRRDVTAYLTGLQLYRARNS